MPKNQYWSELKYFTDFNYVNTGSTGQGVKNT